MRFNSIDNNPPCITLLYRDEQFTFGSKALELLQHPAGRRAVLRRLRRAVDLSAIPEDGGRAVTAAVQQAIAHSQGQRLALVAGQRWRRAGSSLPPYAGGTRQTGGH